MKPWREIAVPHPDVLEGTFQQSEFAADISAVRDGKATHEYQDPAAFFQRTFITQGMRQLLTQVALRLNGKGGEPVIQLQTAFGGGKTHTMLAVFHLGTRQCPFDDLAGIPALLDQAGLWDVPRARVAVIDGNNHSPGQPWKRRQTQIHTLWGELAWQIGGDAGYAMVQNADQSGTSPGKEVLQALLEEFAPCIVLVDELVAYIRQFADEQTLSGGTYESNLSFVQSLTEAVKLVPNAVLLASLPESDPKRDKPESNVQVGGPRGLRALRALENIFGRVQSLWKPVATEEAFEIVRRRLFEPIRDAVARDAVCRAFADTYTAEGTKLPSETHESRYYERLVQAYPIHPEVFDRLYEDWTTLEGFQRTRGVLKLMARVIFRLWKDQNRDYLIMPGSLPLYESHTRNELVYYLPPGWDPVIERDIDGERSETDELERKEPRFGAVNAAKRVARTLFLGSAPASAGTHKGVRGLDRARILLGCLQPGQSRAAFDDALGRLCDRLHYLNTSGDKAQDTTRFWFDTRPNLRREMEDRKGRFDERRDVREKIASALRAITVGTSYFDGIHVFTPSGDIPNDEAMRIVFLPLDAAYSKQDPKAVEAAMTDVLKNHGQKPRYRSNRLVFVAAEESSLPRVRDAVRTALAWESIVKDIEGKRLNIDRLQEEQAKKAFENTASHIQGLVRDCFKWLLCPVMASPTDREATVEVYPLTPGGSYGAEIDRICKENELVVTEWSPFHLRAKLRELYWKNGTTTARAAAVWEDMQRYFYLPRLRRRGVLEQAISKGAASRDFFGTAYGQTGDRFDGFKLGDPNMQFDDTLLLIDPDAALAYETARKKSAPPPAVEQTTPPSPRPELTAPVETRGGVDVKGRPTAQQSLFTALKAKAFFGSVDVNATTAKMKLVAIAEEVVAVLAADPNATVRVTVEITAEFPEGASDQTKRAVSENAAALGFKNKSWE
jgi:predicted AAA+ superfamily ATPase